MNLSNLLRTLWIFQTFLVTLQLHLSAPCIQAGTFPLELFLGSPGKFSCLAWPFPSLSSLYFRASNGISQGYSGIFPNILKASLLRTLDNWGETKEKKNQNRKEFKGWENGNQFFLCIDLILNLCSGRTLFFFRECYPWYFEAGYAVRGLSLRSLGLPECPLPGKAPKETWQCYCSGAGEARIETSGKQGSCSSTTSKTTCFTLISINNSCPASCRPCSDPPAHSEGASPHPLCLCSSLLSIGSWTQMGNQWGENASSPWTRVIHETRPCKPFLLPVILQLIGQLLCQKTSPPPTASKIYTGGW